MTRHIARLILVAVTVLCSTAVADIPPPPPEVPLTEFTLPGPGMMLIAGLLITAGMFWMAKAAAGRTGQTGISSRAKIILVAMLAVVGSAVGYAKVQYDAYQDLRNNWRSPGPVPPLEPVEPPVADADELAENETPTDPQQPESATVSESSVE